MSGRDSTSGNGTATLEESYRRIRGSVGIVDFSGRGIVHLAGPDGAEFLQGLVTNDVAGLSEGTGCSAAILTPTGKIFAMLSVFRPGSDALYLLLQGPGGGRVVDFLERYHFNEHVEITDLTERMVWLSLQGPRAPASALRIVGDVLDPCAFRSRSFAGRTLRALRLDEVGVPGLHFLVHKEVGAELRRSLEEAASAEGGGPASLEAWSVRRVEAGVPWEGEELDEGVLPMEAGLSSILDMNKGCFIGQEVVSRGMVQGRTNWTLWGLRLPPGAPVGPGQELRVSERPRPVVRVRSVVRSPITAEPLALAFVHREVARAGPLAVRTDGDELEIRLEPLPFALGPMPPAKTGGA